MGSSFSLVLYGADRARLETTADLAFREAHRLDAMLSNYRPESEWSRVNREAAAHPVEVTPELFSVLSSCLEYSRLSDGAFDITVGPLLKVWGFYNGEGSMPRPVRSVEDEREARAHRLLAPFEPDGVPSCMGGSRPVRSRRRQDQRHEYRHVSHLQHPDLSGGLYLSSRSRRCGGRGFSSAWANLLVTDPTLAPRVRASTASEPRDRSAPSKRRARARVGESEGQSPSE